MLKIVTDDNERDDLVPMLDELVAEGARRMLLAGLEAEVADYVDRHVGQVDEEGRRLVVRNGRAGERTLLTGAGAFRIQAPRVNDRRDGRRFSSSILSAYAASVPQGWGTCCRCCISVASRPAISLRRLRSSSARMPACRRRRSPACLRRGRTSTQRSRVGTCPVTITCMCGPTGYISGSAWRRTGCAVWSLLG